MAQAPVIKVRLTTLADVLPAAHVAFATPLMEPPEPYDCWLSALLSGDDTQIDDFVLANARIELARVLASVD